MTSEKPMPASLSELQERIDEAVGLLAQFGDQGKILARRSASDGAGVVTAEISLPKQPSPSESGLVGSVVVPGSASPTKPVNVPS